MVVVMFGISVLMMSLPEEMLPDKSLSVLKSYFVRISTKKKEEAMME